MPASMSALRRSAASLRNACSSGKPRVTMLPSTATGRHLVMSGLVGGFSLSCATMAGQAASSSARAGSVAGADDGRRLRPDGRLPSGLGQLRHGLVRGGRRLCGHGIHLRRLRPGRDRHGGHGRRRGPPWIGRRGARRCPDGLGLGRRSGWRLGGDRRRGRDLPRRSGGADLRRQVRTARVRAAAGGRRCRRASGSIAASRRAASATAVRSTLIGRGQPGDQASPQQVDGLVEQGPRVAAALLEGIEQRDAGRGVVARSGPSTNASTASASARPSRSRTSASVIDSGAADRSWSSIDSASRIPPAASRAMRWTAAGSAFRPSASRIRVSLPSISATVSRRTS